MAAASRLAGVVVEDAHVMAVAGVVTDAATLAITIAIGGGGPLAVVLFLATPADAIATTEWRRALGMWTEPITTCDACAYPSRVPVPKPALANTLAAVRFDLKINTTVNSVPEELMETFCGAHIEWPPPTSELGYTDTLATVYTDFKVNVTRARNYIVKIKTRVVVPGECTPTHSAASALAPLFNWLLSSSSNGFTAIAPPTFNHLQLAPPTSYQLTPAVCTSVCPSVFGGDPSSSACNVWLALLLSCIACLCVCAAMRNYRCRYCWSFRCYYSRRNITARVMYYLTMSARAAVIRTVCVLAAIGFAAGAAPITPQLPPRSDRAQQQSDSRAAPSVLYTPTELADLHYDIAHGTTSASPPSSPDMDEPSSYDITTWRVFIMLCSICVPLCFIMYRYRCKVGFFAEMRWALPSGNTAIRSVRWTLPFEPHPMPRCHPPPVSRPDRQSSPEPEQNPSYGYLRRRFTQQTAELRDLRTSNTEQSARLAIAAEKSSVSMRAAGAEIISLGDAYERSKIEGRRLLAALQQSTELNVATTVELNVARARLTGYTRELDVAHARLADMAEDFAQHRLHDDDDEDTATPAIAIAVPVLQDTPVGGGGLHHLH
jgi:hypothetical protein